jgi:hypothetical protein
VKFGAIAPVRAGIQGDEMKFALALLAAPIGYVLLSGYLFSKVRPLPITDFPDIRTGERTRALAA